MTKCITSVLVYGSSALVLFLLFGFSNSQNAASDICVGCICEAASNCNTSLGCQGGVCGLFRITWAYWADSGKPVIAQDDPNAPDAYQRCVTEPYCASRSVQGYISRFAKDCNNDGVVDCTDYALLHHLGGYGCNGNPNSAYIDKFRVCAEAARQLSGGALV